jgi:hypothetical protein
VEPLARVRFSPPAPFKFFHFLLFVVRKDSYEWSREIKKEYANSPVLTPKPIYELLAECPGDIKLYMIACYTFFRPLRSALATEFILPSSLYSNFRKPAVCTSISGYELRDNFSLQEYEDSLLEMNCPGKSAKEMAEITGSGVPMTKRRLNELSSRGILSCRRERHYGRKAVGKPSTLFYVTNRQALAFASASLEAAEFDEYMKGILVRCAKERHHVQEPT